MTDTDLITAPAEQESAGSAGPESGQTATKTRSRARTGLSGMVLSELRTVAGELGIKGTSGMRKGDLIAAIKERQAAGGAGAKADAKSESAEAKSESRGQGAEAASADDSRPTAAEAAETSEAGRGSRLRGGAAKNEADEASGEAKGGADKNEADNAKADKGEATGDKTPESKGAGDKGAEDKGEAKGDADNGEQRNRRNRNQNRDNRDDDGEGGNGRRRGRRFRERRRGRDRDSQNEPQVSEDDVLQPVAGILDVLDNYAFVRTSGYLAGPNDVYVSMNMVRKYGLRRGDAITGAVKVPREGEQQNQRQKFNPLVRIDTVNGGDVEAAKRRPSSTSSPRSTPTSGCGSRPLRSGCRPA